MIELAQWSLVCVNVLWMVGNWPICRSIYADGDEQMAAIEAKNRIVPRKLREMTAFQDSFCAGRRQVIGEVGIPLAKFFSSPA